MGQMGKSRRRREQSNNQGRVEVQGRMREAGKPCQSTGHNGADLGVVSKCILAILADNFVMAGWL